MALTNEQVAEAARIAGDLIAQGIDLCRVEVTSYGEPPSIWLQNGRDMPKIARMMKSARKGDHPTVYELTGKIDGVEVEVCASRSEVCRVKGYQEVEMPARTERRPIYECDPILPEQHTLATSDEGGA